MTDDMHGLVSAVRAQNLGDALTAVATTGDTVLHVGDVADFAEEGGYLTMPGLTFGGIPLHIAYTTVDDDAGTITLAPGVLPIADGSPFPAGTEVYVWDNSNGQPAVRYIATVDSVDGFDGDPIEAVVDQSLAHALDQAMRTDTGESVTLVRDGSRLRVAAVHGRNNALASLQYLQGGMTTRQNDTDAGVDILGADSGTPGVYLYDTGGDLAMQITDDTAGGVTKFWTGAAAETGPGYINPHIVGSNPAVQIGSPLTTGGRSTIDVLTNLISITQPSGALTQFTRNVLVNGFLEAGSIESDGTLTSDTGGIFMTDLTGGGTTTASINGSGRVIRTPSSRRYKSNIKPLKLDEARKVLDLEPVTFTLKEEARAKGRRTYPGFIAEQASDVGAELWVNRDAEGNPDGFRYGEVAAALVLLVREQQAALDRLEEANRHLAKRLHDLEGGASVTGRGMSVAAVSVTRMEDESAQIEGRDLP